jgi:hypothetical protein
MTLSQDLSPWLELVKDKPCWIYPACNKWKPLEVARAWSKLMWQRGADGLYLFNWGHLLYGHDKQTPPTSDNRLGTVWFDEVHPDYYQILHEMGDPQKLAFRDDVYNLESISHEHRPGEGAKNQRDSRGLHDITLPIDFSPGEHKLEFGFADDLPAAQERGMSPTVKLRMMIHNYTQPDEFEVSLNGKLLPTDSREERAQFIMDNWTWITYPLPLDDLNLGQNDLTFSVKSTNPGIEGDPRLDNVEVHVKYV